MTQRLVDVFPAAAPGARNHWFIRHLRLSPIAGYIGPEKPCDSNVRFSLDFVDYVSTLNIKSTTCRQTPTKKIGSSRQVEPRTCAFGKRKTMLSKMLSPAVRAL